MSASARPVHEPPRWPFRDSAREPVAASHGMVASTDRLATEAGRDILRSGGHAVDAAVAVSFALAVVNPEAGNLGGGGFTLIRTAGGEIHGLDHRSSAPAAATRDMFLDAAGERTERAEAGPLAAAVPGSVRGMWEAHRRFGVRPWEELVDPAVALAREFTVTERFARSYPDHIVEGLRRFPGSAGIFLPGGRPPRPGEPFRQPDLAVTLERIRDGGPEGFYTGETARRIASGMRAGGGVVTEEDLASYRPVWRPPVRFRYRDHTVVSMPPSSSGGVTLAETAHVLGCFDLGGLSWHGARHVHLLVEAWRRAFADRNHYLADPDFVEQPLDVLCSEPYGRFRSEGVSPGAASTSAEVGPGVEVFLGGRPTEARGTGGGGNHTTHYSIVDPDGNAVSATTTLNTWYGSKWVAPGTGVLMNNEMDDFTARPGVPNHFGLVQGEANTIAPGKRPLSAMAPAMVLDPDGGLFLVVGTPGGATILTTVFQVVSNILDHAMALGPAVHAPRVHHQHLPDRIEIEPGALPGSVRDELEAMGHRVEVRDEPWGDVQAVLVEKDGRLSGVADPRRGGAALGF